MEQNTSWYSTSDPTNCRTTAELAALLERAGIVKKGKGQEYLDALPCGAVVGTGVSCYEKSKGEEENGNEH